MTDTDAIAMRRALELAERGRATVRPNPLVGCVVIHDGDVVGEGWHERPGGPHAEVVALAAAGDRARGATAYVTLEPCTHHGRTGPCVPALLAAGVARVVVATRDPHPAAAGGVDALRAAGVEVSVGVEEEAARRQNEVFLHVHTTGRCWVNLKVAQTLDGRVAARDGTSRWITSDEARREVHRLRAASDAVLVGSGTVLADDPRLDAREVELPAGQPRPVVLDARGRTPVGATVIRTGTVMVTTSDAPAGWRSTIADAGVDVVEVPAGPDGGVDLEAALAALAGIDVHLVLVEAGPTLAGALLRRGLVDQLTIHIAPSILGGDARPSVGAPGAPTLADRWSWRLDRVRRLGPDLEITARPTD